MDENQCVRGATLDVLQKYSQFLNDKPETKTVLAQDETLASLLLLTLKESEDQKIIRTTLEILLELISCVGNKTKSVLCSDSNCKSAMTNLTEKFKNDPNVVFICESILDLLFPEHRTALKTASKVGTGNQSRAKRFLAGSSRQQAKTLIFQSTFFSDSTIKRAIEQNLVTIKGVVSIYFDSSANKTWRCILRVWTTVSPQTIADVMLATERVSMVQQISKDEYGDEILISYQNDNTQSNQRTKTPSSPLPAYLEENDDIAFGLVIGDRALAKYGDMENQNNKSGGWLSNVTSFISNKLYW